MFQSKSAVVTGLVGLIMASQSAIAQYYSPYDGYYGDNRGYYPQCGYSSSYYPNQGYGDYGSSAYDSHGYYPNTYNSYGYTTPNYSTGYYADPAYGSNYYYGQPEYGTTNYSFSSYRAPYYQRPYRPPYKKKDGGRDFADDLWPSGRDNIYTDIFPVHGPWDRGWGRAPWNRDYENLWDDSGGGPEKWFDMDDPQEGLAWMWEDFLYTPNALGRMPGGWDAPTFAVPNPVDVGDELKNASTDFPGEVKDFSEGFTMGDRTIIGTKPKKDSGSFGLGDDDDEEDGINIAPKVRR